MNNHPHLSSTHGSHETLLGISPKPQEVDLDKETLALHSFHFIDSSDARSISPSDLQLAQIFWVIVKQRGRIEAKSTLIHQGWDVSPQDCVELWRKARLAASSDGERDLAEMLRLALKIGTFETIRKAEFLRQPPLEHSLVRAWNAPYQGDKHEVLYCTIQGMMTAGNNVKKANPGKAAKYSPGIAPIIQGSGSGKSRMVHETSALVVTVPFNIREEQDPSLPLAYPPSDSVIRNYLSASGCHDKLDTRMVHLRFHCFFGCLFPAMEKILIDLARESGQLTLASRLKKYLSVKEIRDRLYQEVTSSAERSVGELMGNDDAAAELNLALVHRARDEAKQALGSLIKIIADSDSKTASSSVMLLIYFDESHKLTEYHTRNPDGMNFYQILQSALNTYSEYPLFTLFISASVKISALIHPVGSARNLEQANEMISNPPITDTPLDCSPIFPLPAFDEFRLDDVKDLYFLRNFGRVMHQAMLQGDDPAILRKHIEFLRAKLINKTDIVSPCNLGKLEACIAVVDPRIAFGYNIISQQNQCLQGELVASHMRHIYGVNRTHNLVNSGYPSDPLVAEAAAQQLFVWKQLADRHHALPIATVFEYCANGNRIDTEDCECSAARAILIQAYDNAVAKEHGFTEGTPLDPFPFLFSDGCSLLEFFHQLFPDKFYDLIRESLPANRGSRKFQDAFANSWVRFTHFMRCNDRSMFIEDIASAGFLHGMAYTCETEIEDGVVIVIPILLDKHQPISPQNMTALFIQVGTFPEITTALDNFPIDINDFTIPYFYSQKKGDRRPYIGMVMDFSFYDSEYEVPSPEEDEHRAYTSLTVRCLPPQHPPAPSDTHPRYEIRGVGLLDLLYRVIDEKDEPLYKKFLRDDSESSVFMFGRMMSLLAAHSRGSW